VTRSGPPVTAMAERCLPEPAERIFALVSDLRTEPGWDPLVVSTHALDPQPGPGARYVERLRPTGTLTTETVSYQPPTAVGYAGHSNLGFRLDLEFTISPLPGSGSRIVLSGCWQGSGPTRWGTPLVRALLAAELRARLVAVQRVLRRS
jgi:uncharacterized protein YndB with AHSA1/START domain